MAMLSTSAWVLHDLGLAAGFGGPLFGRLALHKAVQDIHSEEERGKVLHGAWSNYNAVTAASLGIAALTWFAGRAAISGRSIDRQTRGLVIAKDILLGAAVITGAANILSGQELGRTAPEGAVPVRTGDEPSPQAPEKAQGLMNFLRVMGPVNLACTAGVIGITAMLAMKSGRSTKWSFISALLP